MILSIDPTSDEPLFRQIAAEVRAALARGELGAGDRLPSARELARSLDVNMHTVLRAYGDLRDEGLVSMRRGRGVVVIGDADLRARLLELARAFIDEARKQGLGAEQMQALLEEAG